MKIIYYSILHAMSTIFNGIPSDFYVYVNAHLKNYIFDCASVYIHICIYIYIYICLLSYWVLWHRHLSREWCWSKWIKCKVGSCARISKLWMHAVQVYLYLRSDHWIESPYVCEPTHVDSLSVFVIRLFNELYRL